MDEQKYIRVDELIDVLRAEKSNIGEDAMYYVWDLIEDFPAKSPAEIMREAWIPVTERLPNDKETCLIWYEYYHYSFERVLPEYGIGFYISMYNMWYGDPSTGKDVKVLYWMPLPEPPKDGET